MAGHVGLELRNVVAKYPFERSHRFPGGSGRIPAGRPLAFELQRRGYAARGWVLPGSSASVLHRDEPCKSPLGCAHTFMVNCSILFGTRTLPMARSSCGVCAPWAFATSRLHPDRGGRTRQLPSGSRVASHQPWVGAVSAGDSASSGPPSWGSAGMPSSFGCRG